MKSVRIPAFLLFSLLPVAGEAAPSTDLQAVLTRLKPDKTLRIDSRLQGRVEGRYIGWTEESLQLQSKEGPREVSLEGIERLWTHGRQTKKGALTGGILGAIALGLIGVMESDECDYDCEGRTAHWAVVGASAGALLGTASGALIGTVLPDWSLRYERQE